MAEEQRIFTIKINAAETEKEIARLTAELKRATEAQKQLDKEFAKGTKTEEQYGEEASKNKRTITELGGELRANTKILALHTKQTIEADGSNEQLKAQLSLLTRQYNLLSREQKQNSEVGGVLQKQIRAISDELKETEGALGNNARNVGNYGKAISEALGAAGPWGAKLNELKSIYDDSKDKLSSLGGALKGYVTGSSEAADASQDTAVATSAMGTASKAASVSVGLGTKALRIFKVALAATGIGLIVIALGSLIAMLTKTQGGMNLVERATNAVGAVFNVLLDRASVLGEAIVELFEGNFAKSAELAKKAMAGVGDEIMREIALTDQLTLAQQRLDKETIKNIATNKTLLGEIEKLKNIRDNEFNSISKRQKANEEAFKKEKQRLEILEGLQLRQVEIARERLKLDAVNGENTNEQLRALAEEEEKLADIREDAYGKQNELITNRYQLEQERIAQIKEAAEKADRDAISRIEAEILKIGETNAKKLDLLQKLVDKQRDAELRNEELTQGERLKITAKAEADKQKLREDYQKDTAAKIKALAEKEYQDALTMVNGFIAQQEAQLTQSQIEEVNAANGNAEKLKDIEERYAEAMKMLQLQRLQAQKVQQENYGQSTIETDAAINSTLLQQAKERADKTIRIEEEAAKKRINAKQAEFMAAQAVSGAIVALSDAAGAKTAEFAEFAKAAALFQIGVDTALSLTALTQTATIVGGKVAAISGPAGLITGPAASAIYYGTGAATILSAIAQARAILTEPPKFDKGGYTGSGFGSPDSSGYKVAGIVHENEYVTPEVVLKDPRAAMPLMQLETLRQMKLPGYSTGGMVKGIQLAPPSKDITIDMFKSNYGAPAMPQMIDYGKLAAAMAKINVSVAVDEINNAQAHKANTQNRASIR